MIGDPSGKSEERNLLSLEALRGQRRRHGAAVAAVPRFRLRPELGPAGEQLRLDGPLRLPRIPPRRRQAFSRQRDARQGFGQQPAGADRRRPELHRVQLHAACRPTISSISTSITAASCRPAAATSGATSRPASTWPGGCAACSSTAHLPAVDQERRHEDGQDRVGRPLALGRADQPLPVLSILDQRRRRRRGQLPAVLHRPGPRAKSRRSMAEHAGRPRPADSPAAAGRRADPAGPRRRGPGARPSGRRKSSSAPRSTRLSDAQLAEIFADVPSKELPRAPAGRRRLDRSSTPWSRPAWPRARARPGGPSSKAGPTSTIAASKGSPRSSAQSNWPASRSWSSARARRTTPCCGSSIETAPLSAACPRHFRRAAKRLVDGSSGRFARC